MSSGRAARQTRTVPDGSSDFDRGRGVSADPLMGRYLVVRLYGLTLLGRRSSFSSCSLVPGSGEQMIGADDVKPAMVVS
jgi:hypothetical protein